MLDFIVQILFLIRNLFLLILFGLLIYGAYLCLDLWLVNRMVKKELKRRERVERAISAGFRERGEAH